MLALVDRAEYKRRQAPPGIKITPRAFGRDRRMPITNRYRLGEGSGRAFAGAGASGGDAAWATAGHVREGERRWLLERWRIASRYARTITARGESGLAGPSSSPTQPPLTFATRRGGRPSCGRARRGARRRR